MAFNVNKLNNSIKLIEEAIKAGIFPCAAAAVGDRSGFLRVEIVGNKRIVPFKEALNRESLFDLASLTKVIATNMLFMVMLQRGEISIFDKVCYFIPNFIGRGKEEITLFQLLTHTSGLPAYISLYKKCRDYEDSIDYICKEVKLKGILKKAKQGDSFSGTKLGDIYGDGFFEQGNDVEYSDLNFILLGKILELVGGEKLHRLCERDVFRPLGMKSTGFNPISQDIVPTEIDAVTKQVLCGICHDENARCFGGVSGHAGLFSNIDDMARFSEMLVNGGRVGNDIFLSHATFKTMIRNYTEQLSENRALGWCVKGLRLSSGGDIISKTAFGHTGFTGTSLWIDPEYGVYIVLLTNRVHPTRENHGIIRLRRLFHNAVMASVLA